MVIDCTDVASSWIRRAFGILPIYVAVVADMDRQPVVAAGMSIATGTISLNRELVAALAHRASSTIRGVARGHLAT